MIKRDRIGAGAAAGPWHPSLCGARHVFAEGRRYCACRRYRSELIGLRPGDPLRWLRMWWIAILTFGASTVLLAVPTHSVWRGAIGAVFVTAAIVLRATKPEWPD